jgi:hypothetical protein
LLKNIWQRFCKDETQKRINKEENKDHFKDREIIYQVTNKITSIHGEMLG